MSEWPTNTELSDALEAAGIPVPASGVLASSLALAVSAFEDATGWYPFAAAEDATAQESTLSLPSRSLVSVVGFGGGLLTGTAPTISLNDTDLVAGTDYTLCPPEAPRKGTPYTYLKLRYKKVSSLDTLSASGIWGYCAHDAVPELARAAVLAYAAMEIAAPSIQSGTATTGKQRIDQGTVTIQYGSTIEERQAAVRSWQASWDMAVGHYRKQKVY
jgi:hypothetical protein